MHSAICVGKKQTIDSARCHEAQATKWPTKLWSDTQPPRVRCLRLARDRNESSWPWSLQTSERTISPNIDLFAPDGENNRVSLTGSVQETAVVVPEHLTAHVKKNVVFLVRNFTTESFYPATNVLKFPRYATYSGRTSDQSPNKLLLPSN
jgi:hypothetical protein